MPTTWLTCREIAARLGRPISTVRSWRDRYRSVLPEQRDERGHQTFPFELFERVAHLAGQKMTPREILADLGRWSDPERLADVTAGMPMIGTTIQPLQEVVERLGRVEAQLTRVEGLLTEAVPLLARLAAFLGLPDA